MTRLTVIATFFLLLSASALTATSLVTSGIGLVLFFVGLGLDIHAHVLRAHASGLALTPNGLSLSF